MSELSAIEGCILSGEERKSATLSVFPQENQTNAKRQNAAALSCLMDYMLCMALAVEI
jgi:hypothetical protein